MTQGNFVGLVAMMTFSLFTTPLCFLRLVPSLPSTRHRLILTMMPNNNRISSALQSAALLFLALQLPCLTSAKTYTAGSTTVSISQETFADSNNSTKRCVTYTSNIPEKYDTACFTSVYSDGGTFINCYVDFQETCNRCAPCTTAEVEVGFTLDCNNAQPDEDTMGLCTEFSDLSVQQVLVDNVFDNMLFDWEEAEALESAEEGGDNSGDNDNSAAAAAAGGGVLSMLLLATAVVMNLIA